jgi:hypothetical protein
MSHTVSYQKGQTILADDVNRAFSLLRNNIDISPVNLASWLHQQIDFETLSPELRTWLNSLSISVSPIRQSWTQTNPVNTDFDLTSTPSSGSEQVFVQGTLKQTSDYSFVSGGANDILRFSVAPNQNDKIDIFYRTTTLSSPAIYSHLTLEHKEISRIISLADYFILYGVNKISGEKEIAKYRVIDMSVVLTNVDVDSGNPDYPPTTVLGNYVWGIGSGSETSMGNKIKISDMTSVPVIFTSDTSSTVSSICNDGIHVYAMLKGGSIDFANRIVKISPLDIAPYYEVVGAINSGLTVTGNTDMLVSNSGFLYVALQDVSVYQVRKYDLIPANGMLKEFQFLGCPIKILAVDTNVYVLEGNNLQSINTSTDVVTSLQIYGFVGSTMEFDGVNLWIASGDTLYKCKMDGTILQTLVPYSGLTIKSILSANGFIWVTYTSDNDINVTRAFPGMPDI